jgi:hypothetical protein
MKNFTHGYALLIGVGESAVPGLSLPVSVNDTQAIYGALIDPDLCGYIDDKHHIKTLNNEDATKANILAGLDWLRLQAKKDTEATIFIYYSGHGWVDKTDKSYYLIPHDIDEMPNSALSSQDFIEALRKIDAKRLLVVIDSCHAAGMATSKDLEKTDTELSEKFNSFVNSVPSKQLFSEKIKQRDGRVVFTSSSGEEKSWYKEDQTISFYTFHFLEALQGAGNKPGDTEVKVSNLMNYLGETVNKTVRKLCNAEQNPRFDFDTVDFAIANLRGGKGLPEKGWDEVKQEATQKINKIADVIHQHGKYITNITEGHNIYIGGGKK